MLHRMCQAPLSSYDTTRPVVEKSTYERNEQEDVKKAIELLYQFKENLLKLHPVALEVVDQLFQRHRY